MSNNKKRRDLLKKLSVGVTWSAPIVSSSLLPVHAQATGTPPPPPIVPPPPVTVNQTFNAAGTNSFVIPSGISQLRITVDGAGGGTGNDKSILVGGNGESVSQSVTVTAGDTLSITVGGGGFDAFDGKGIAADAGKGGTPGGGSDATNTFRAGGGGGFSEVTGTGVSIQAGGGGGGSGAGKSKAVGGKGGGISGGTGGINSNGSNAGNGLGGAGSATSPTSNNPPLQGDDGSVNLSSI